MTDRTPGPDAQAAHVQVLTAEVRTLVVGSRQVTMSVYDQLDNVPPNEIEPFGRVSPKNSSYPWLYLYVVGRHTTTGALVRSQVPRSPHSLDARGYQHSGTGTQTSYRHWREDADAELQRQQLEEVAAQWSALPLIVLAGLR